VKKHTISVPLALALSAFAIGQQAGPRSSGGIDGLVRYPDGSPSAGATVWAITECKEMGYNSVQKVTTSSNGSFYVPPFMDASCNRVRLSAERSEDLWLKTGHDVFYGGDNGTTPVVEDSQSGSPTTTEITLGNRGALVSFRVRDTATDRLIWARLYIERMPVPGATFGSMLIGTGRDGSADTLLLPAGQYDISVEFYDCNGADYYTVSPPRETLTVEAGQRIAKDISVDVRLIKPMKSRNNPHGKPCRPFSGVVSWR
jgi:hypothetical protein